MDGTIPREGWLSPWQQGIGISEQKLNDACKERAHINSF
jgi:hypothetical protein